MLAANAAPKAVPKSRGGLKRACFARIPKQQEVGGSNEVLRTHLQKAFLKVPQSPPIVIIMVIKDDMGFKCAVCNFHYRLSAQAKMCQEFCTKNKACSPEITKNAIERSAK